MKTLTALLLAISYRAQTHFLFHISLRNWLWGLVLVPPALSWMHRLSWLYAVPLSLLGALLLAAIEVARRAGFLRFEPAPVSKISAPVVPIQVDEQVSCRVSGHFGVANKQRTMVDEQGQISAVRTRERVVSVRIKQTRFLLLARSLQEETGWWYVFFMPAQVQHIETGCVRCGLRSRHGLAIQYQPAKESAPPEMVYLSFDSIHDLHRVLVGLRMDVPAEAFAQAASVPD
jgi:hypothetical protein